MNDQERISHIKKLISEIESHLLRIGEGTIFEEKRLALTLLESLARAIGRLRR